MTCTTGADCMFLALAIVMALVPAAAMLLQWAWDEWKRGRK